MSRTNGTNGSTTNGMSSVASLINKFSETANAEPLVSRAEAPVSKTEAPLSKELNKLEKMFEINQQKLKKISARFEEELREGLLHRQF